MHGGHVLLALYGVSAALALSAGIGAWRRRHEASAGAPLAVVMFGLSWWSVADLGQGIIPSGPARPIGNLLVIAGVGAVVAGFFCEARALVDHAWRPSRRLIVLLAIHPIAMTAIAVANPWHGLLGEFRAEAGEVWLSFRPGTLFWIHFAYCYLLLAWSFAVVVRGVRRSTAPLQRRQLRTILLAAVIPTVGNLVSVGRPGGEAGADLTPVFMIVTALIHYYAVFRQGLLRLLPVARDLVLDTVSDAVFVIDVHGAITDVNPAAERLARRIDPALPAELIGVALRRFLPSTRYRRVLTDGEYHVDHADGMTDLDLRVSDLADRNGRPLGRVVVARDITELNDQRRRLADVNGRLVEQLQIINRLRHELAELAVRDELTGLYNRRHLLAELEAELDRARSDGAPLTLVLLDIDHFKSVNDRFGHAVGDDLLTAMARALAQGVRPGDTVARVGGEEFVVLLPGVGTRQAVPYAELLRRRCSTVLVDTRDGPLSATVSLGVATFPECGRTSTALLQGADDALYQAKGSGRDRVVAARTA